MVKTLVFSAAGRSGVAYVGAVKSLEQRKQLVGLETLRGISSGAVAATMVSMRIPSQQMMQMLGGMPATVLCNSNPSMLLRLRDRWGVADITDTLAPVLDQFLPRTLTFRESKDAGNTALNVYAFDVQSKRLLEMNHRRSPDVPIYDAVLASCCIPFLYRPHVIDGRTYLDGAVVRRTPLFDPGDPETLVVDVDSRKDLQVSSFQDLLDLVVLSVNRSDHYATNYTTIQVGVRDTVEEMVNKGFHAMEARVSPERVA
jgi:predicted acylesterase/phospholipase RssA